MMTKKKKKETKTMVEVTLHRKRDIGQHEPNHTKNKTAGNSGTPVRVDNPCSTNLVTIVMNGESTKL